MSNKIKMRNVGAQTQKKWSPGGPPPEVLGAQNFTFFFVLAAGVSHDSPRAQTCTFEGPGASNTTKIPREDPQRERKSENGGGRGNKKRESLGGPAEVGPGGGWSGGGGSAVGVRRMMFPVEEMKKL